VREYPQELTGPVREVLSLMNFQTCPIAHLLRDAGGWDIPKKCEDEQAVVLHWMIGLALEHGDGWRKAVNDYLSPLVAALKEKETTRLTEATK